MREISTKITGAMYGDWGVIRQSPNTNSLIMIKRTD